MNTRQTTFEPLSASVLFDRCVVRTCQGRSIRCRIGLWSVSAPDAATAEREARHYWIQYFDEYQKPHNGQPPSRCHQRKAKNVTAAHILGDGGKGKFSAA